MVIEFRGREFPLATTLRVAYLVQGQHNHKPYTEIFENIDKMTLEDQIGIVWAAFAAANKEECTFIKRKDFQEEFLDNYNLGDMMNMIKDIISGIMGKELSDMADKQLTEELEESDENFHLEPGMESSEEDTKLD